MIPASGPLLKLRRMARERAKEPFLPHQTYNHVSGSGKSPENGSQREKQLVAAMKALTLKQPWAGMVANGTKTIETRTWSTSYRGPLAIHASQPDGCIVATAVLTKVRPLVFEDIIAARFHAFEEGRFAWDLSDIRQVLPPIPARGKLGLWNVPPGALAAINAASKPLIALCHRAEFQECYGCGAVEGVVHHHDSVRLCFQCLVEFQDVGLSVA